MTARASALAVVGLVVVCLTVHPCRAVASSIAWTGGTRGLEIKLIRGAPVRACSNIMSLAQQRLRFRKIAMIVILN